jgi:HrpA-like RNA helicase
VQRLPIEPVSQASANQRAGRCGRTEDGICIRLYSEEDYLSRPRFTDPEILRTNLASVVLQMATLGLGEVASFGFVDPPDARAIRDGVQLLEELGALEPGVGAPDKRLTAIGRRLARLPLDPRLARMVLEADRLGCVREVVVIAAALAIQDPRERPPTPDAGDAAHARFSDPTSDLLGHLALWRYLREQQRELSSSRFRRCAAPSTSTTCACGSGRTSWRSCAGCCPSWRSPSPALRTIPDRCTRHCWPACCRTWGCGSATRATTWGHGVRGSACSRAPRWHVPDRSG